MNSIIQIEDLYRKAQIEYYQDLDNDYKFLVYDKLRSIFNYIYKDNMINFIDYLGIVVSENLFDYSPDDIRYLMQNERDIYRKYQDDSTNILWDLIKERISFRKKRLQIYSISDYYACVKKYFQLTEKAISELDRMFFNCLPLMYRYLDKKSYLFGNCESYKNMIRQELVDDFKINQCEAMSICDNLLCRKIIKHGRQKLKLQILQRDDTIIRKQTPFSFYSYLSGSGLFIPDRNISSIRDALVLVHEYGHCFYHNYRILNNDFYSYRTNDVVSEAMAFYLEQDFLSLYKSKAFAAKRIEVFFSYLVKQLLYSNIECTIYSNNQSDISLYKIYQDQIAEFYNNIENNEQSRCINYFTGIHFINSLAFWKYIIAFLIVEYIKLRDEKSPLMLLELTYQVIINEVNNDITELIQYITNNIEAMINEFK